MTISVPPAALDARIFSDYQQLKRFFYVFFMKTARAEAVIAAGDMAFLDRLWEDWSPGYDATEDVRNAKRCVRAAGHLSAAIGYYRADEPGLYENQPPDAYAAEHAALLRTAPQPTLYLHGDRDGCIDVALVADAQNHLAQDSRMEVIEGVGHFLHVERPRAVNERILAWILS